MDAVNPESEVSPKRLDRYGRKEVVGGFWRVALLAATLFPSAGSIAWPAGWVFILLSLIFHAAGALLLIRVNPEVLNARGRKPKEVPGFDKIILPAWIIASFAWRILAGLDYGRMHWTEMHLGFSVFGLAIMAAGAVLLIWSMAVNAHFEVTVRIQEDRGHRVCVSGPYRLVRHPGYAGVILAALGGPLLLGSWPALAAGAVSAALMAVRTALEDRVLTENLAGYAEFRAETRYRLVPGLW